MPFYILSEAEGIGIFGCAKSEQGGDKIWYFREK